MSSDIFKFLGGIGTTYLDFKHMLKFKKEGKSQKELRKSEFPSMYIGGIVTLIIVVIGLLIILNFRYRVYPRETQLDINEISEAISEWKKLNGVYPTSIEEMISMRPLRAKWLSDRWGREYKYEILDGNKFILVSSGVDGIFDTKDDIKTSYNTVYN